MLDRLRDALAELGAAYHYFAQPNAVPPYIVWAEDGSEDLEGDNVHTEAGYSGTIDLYTKTEDDPLTADIRGVLDGLECAWYLNSVQYEAETGLLHYEWVWGLV